MLIANQYIIPDECPKKCPGKLDWQGHGGLCHSCPVLNCRKFTELDELGNEIEIQLLRPEDYREDWAKEWERFFREGMINQPYLYL